MSKNFDSKYLVDSKHLVDSKYLADLIKDDYDDEKIEVDWNIDSEDEPKNKIKEMDDIEIEELDDISDLSEILKENTKEKVNPEINIEIVNEDNKKGVKISINMEIDKRVVTIDFVINKKTILKIADELKKL
jgi:hypothetical protein